MRLLVSASESLVSGDAAISCEGGRAGKAEIDLFLEGVHFGDLDFEAVSQADDTTGATANEVVARGFENK